MTSKVDRKISVSRSDAGRLRALLSRAVFLELIELGEERSTATGRDYGVWSQGQFFSLGRLDDDA